MTRISQTMAVGMALLLALSVLAPTVATAQETTTVSVETDAATDVTDASATLNGNLTELSGAESATVYFEYWVEGDSENSKTTTEMNVGTGEFSLPVSGLEKDTTYVYVAHVSAGDATAEGGEQTFTTLSEPPLGVDTLAASEVTPSSATLNGELTGLGGAESATVYFEYWVEGDRENSQTTSEMTVEEAGTFDANVSGLEKDTTYVYVAHAEAGETTVSGTQTTFTPDVPEDGSDQPFGHWVSAFVHSLMNSDDSDERNLGQIVSAFVTENNPGADNRPDHVGPPGEDDGDAESENDDRRGPPDRAGKDDDRPGPPDHAGKDKGDDGDDGNDSDDSDDSDDGNDGEA